MSKINTQRKFQRFINIPLDLDKWLEEIAKDEGISVSALIWDILEDYREAVTGIKKNTALLDEN